jgi:hypothetical protein
VIGMGKMVWEEEGGRPKGRGKAKQDNTKRTKKKEQPPNREFMRPGKMTWPG